MTEGQLIEDDLGIVVGGGEAGGISRPSARTESGEGAATPRRDEGGGDALNAIPL